MTDAVGRQLSEADRAYLAGLIDGDGSVMATIEKHNEKRFGFRVRVTVKITQHRRADVAWLVSHTGIGYIRTSRDNYEWMVRDQQAAYWLLKMVAPYSRIKKQQMTIACQVLKQATKTLNDLRIVANLADKLSALNVRSLNRRKNFAAILSESSPRND